MGIFLYPYLSYSLYQCYISICIPLGVNKSYQEDEIPDISLIIRGVEKMGYVTLIE